MNRAFSAAFWDVLFSMGRRPRLPNECRAFGALNTHPRDLSVRSDWKREWKIAALSVFFFLRSSSQPLSASPFQLRPTARAGRCSPAKPRWAIGETMRPECDARSLWRICLRQPQIFWQLTGRMSSVAQPVRSYVCRLVLRSTSTPAVFAIRDFS